MKYLVVATPDELQLPLAQAAAETYTPIITGVGGTNVIQMLQHLPREAEIFNIGHAGSQCFERGSKVIISKVKLWHPNCTFDEPVFRIGDGSFWCLTAGDFVTSGQLPPLSCVDMELAYIAALGFTNLRSVKYISDALSYSEYAARNAAKTS